MLEWYVAVSFVLLECSEKKTEHARPRCTDRWHLFGESDGDLDRGGQCPPVVYSILNRVGEALEGGPEMKAGLRLTVTHEPQRAALKPYAKSYDGCGRHPGSQGCHSSLLPQQEGLPAALLHAKSRLQDEPTRLREPTS